MAGWSFRPLDKGGGGGALVSKNKGPGPSSRSATTKAGFWLMSGRSCSIRATAFLSWELTSFFMQVLTERVRNRQSHFPT